jgi:hypothetical protein
VGLVELELPRSHVKPQADWRVGTRDNAQVF